MAIRPFAARSMHKHGCNSCSMMHSPTYDWVSNGCLGDLGTRRERKMIRPGLEAIQANQTLLDGHDCDKGARCSHDAGIIVWPGPLLFLCLPGFGDYDTHNNLSIFLFFFSFSSVSETVPAEADNAIHYSVSPISCGYCRVGMSKTGEPSIRHIHFLPVSRTTFSQSSYHRSNPDEC